MPHHTIFIVNQQGQPIPRAGVGPYPLAMLDFRYIFNRYGNSADPEGRVELFDVIPGGEYHLSAPGYQSRSVPFPQRDDTIYILQRAH